MGERTVETLRRRLADGRGGRVIFVSHCLLNENVRYLGGACKPGAVDELVDKWRAEGYGICQMPCPEQRAWGGVLKPRIAVAFGARHRPSWVLRGPMLSASTWYTKLRYRLLARRVANEIRDYVRSGYSVAGVVGVDGSPSCGVRTTLDVHDWLDVVAGYRTDRVDRGELNRDAVIANTMPGSGWFMDALVRRLRRLGVPQPVSAHDLVGELEADASGDRPAGAASDLHGMRDGRSTRLPGMDRADAIRPHHRDAPGRHGSRTRARLHRRDPGVRRRAVRHPRHRRPPRPTIRATGAGSGA